jgi:hypothetical protein
MAIKVKQRKLFEETDDPKPTFQRPDIIKFKEGPGGTSIVEVDKEASEPVKRLGGKVGDNPKGRDLPDVYYAYKRNAYFKNGKLTRPMTDEEVQELGLPIPAEIENERRKLRKRVIDGELELTKDEINSMTTPKKMKPKMTELQEAIQTTNKHLNVK